MVTATGGVAPEAPKVAGWIDWLAFHLAQKMPIMLAMYFTLIKWAAYIPPNLIRKVINGPEKPFLEVILDNNLLPIFMAQTFKQGTAGAIEDFVRSGKLGFNLSEVSFPVLFVQGLKDPFVPPRQTRRWSELVVNSKYLELPEAGHATAIFALSQIQQQLHSR